MKTRLMVMMKITLEAENVQPSSTFETQIEIFIKGLTNQSIIGTAGSQLLPSSPPPQDTTTNSRVLIHI